LKFPDLKVPYLRNLLIMLRFLISASEHRGSSRSDAFEVTLSRFAGGECLPLPGSKGRAFPSCSPSRGAPPHLSRNVAHCPTLFPKKTGNFSLIPACHAQLIRTQQIWKFDVKKAFHRSSKKSMWSIHVS